MPTDHLPMLNSRTGEAKLPQELMDMIIGELRDDKTALKQCSLVSKNWQPRSSRFLLRRVLWPPCADRSGVCKNSPSDPASLPCEYAPQSQNMFALCLQLLSSSPRLQRFVRELVCTSHNKEGERRRDAQRILGVKTFVDIVDCLPYLEAVDLKYPAFRADGSLPSVRTAGRTLKKLSVSSMNPVWLWNLAPFLSSFERVQHLVLTMRNLNPSEWPINPPTSKLAVEILECNVWSMELPEPMTDSVSFYAGLVRNLDLSTLRRFSSTSLRQNTTEFISAATALESLGLHTAHSSLNMPPLSYGRIPPRLTSVDVGCRFGIWSATYPDGLDTWVHIWKTPGAAVQLPTRRIIVNANIIFHRRALTDFSRQGLSALFGATLSEIAQKRDAMHVLHSFGNLESITFVLRFHVRGPASSMMPPHAFEHLVVAMKDTMTNILPARYTHMLQVKAAEM